MKTFKELLITLKACNEAKIWANDMSIEEAIASCQRGDWLLWLAKKVDIPLQALILAKGHCAKTVYHLMKDDRSKKAVDVAIGFGEGINSEEELNNAYYDAYIAYVTTDTTYAAAATDTNTAAATEVATADAYADAVAKTKNQLETANICRKYIGQLIIDKVHLLLAE